MNNFGMFRLIKNNLDFKYFFLNRDTQKYKISIYLIITIISSISYTYIFIISHQCRFKKASNFIRLETI